jgi:predicted tellurium resistance membrane protein TerC
VDWISNPEIWASLLTLTALEIVLGIDNLVFIAILAGRLPAEQQNRARQIGLALALLTRLALLASITWIIGLTQPLFELFGHCLLARHRSDRGRPLPPLQGYAGDPSRPGRQ